MSIYDEKTLTSLYDWLDPIPFSRPQKNIARDFSDGILAAELIKYFFPTLVELHNYPASNSFEQKKINWSTLNQKVLRKLDFPISDPTISELASGSRDAIEYFLYTLKEKIDLYMKNMLEKAKRKRDASQDISRKGSSDDIFKVSHGKGSVQPEDLTEKIETGLKVHDTSVTPKSKILYFGDSNLDMVPREIYDQKVQELLACEEVIQVLKARIQRLENMLQLKNVTIDRQQQTLEKLMVAQSITADKVEEKLYHKKLNK